MMLTSEKVVGNMKIKAPIRFMFQLKILNKLGMDKFLVFKTFDYNKFTIHFKILKKNKVNQRNSRFHCYFQQRDCSSTLNVSLLLLLPITPSVASSASTRRFSTLTEHNLNLLIPRKFYPWLVVFVNLAPSESPQSISI